jgi:hypothetical protein
VLARLEALDGVEEARVDWTGSRILLRGAAPGTVQALKDAGYEAQVVDAQPMVASMREGAPWMRAGETVRLSEREAAALAERWAREACAEAGIVEERDAVRAILEDEFRAALKSLHESGGIGKGDRPGIGPRIVARVVERCGLAGDQRRALEESLRRRLP